VFRGNDSLSLKVPLRLSPAPPPLRPPPVCAEPPGLGASCGAMASSRRSTIFA
jgi:hypothetical protein